MRLQLKITLKLLVAFLIVSGGTYFIFQRYIAPRKQEAASFKIVRTQLSTNTQIANYAASQGIQPPFLLHFFATWCKPCNAEHPWLLYMNKQYNIPIIAVLFRDSPAAFASWSKSHEPYFQHLIMSPEPALVQRLGIRGIPSSFVFMPNKQVARLDFNIQSKKIVDAIANQLLQEDKVAEESTQQEQIAQK